jgi:hypothetical protein
MGVIDGILRLVFGNGRNVVRETAEVFRENAEAGATRSHDLRAATLQQFAAEFAVPRKGLFDRFVDGLNRLPRPAMAIGVLGLMVAAMSDPIWFASRMQGIALVPEPLWWLLGAIVSFYFGARHQAKGQEFERSIAATMARAPVVARNIGVLEALNSGAGQGADPAPELGGGANPALADWRQADER